MFTFTLRKVFLSLIFIATSTLFSPLSYCSSNEIPFYLPAELYGIENGLSQSTVTSIAEDRQGNTWIGTLNGLNKFDGKIFTHYHVGKSKRDLPSSFIQSLYSINDDLLVGTNEGLAIYDGKTDSFKILNRIEEAVWSIAEQRNNIIIGTKKKLYVLEKSTLKTLKTITNNDFDSIKNTIETTHFYYVRNYNGNVVKVNKKELNTSSIIPNVSEIVSFNDQVILLKEKKIIDLSTNLPVFDKKTKHISLFKGKLIALTDNSIISFDKHFNTKTITLLRSPHNKRQKIHGTIDNIFATEINKGFTLITPELSAIKSTRENYNNIWSITTSVTGQVIITNDSPQIKIYDEDLHKYYLVNSNLQGYKIAALINKKLIIGTTSQLIELDIESDSKKIISNQGISSIDEVNGKIIYSTNDFEIYEYDQKNKLNTLIYKLEDELPIFQIVATSENRLLIASQKGFIEIVNGKENYIYTDEIVYSIYYNKKSNITYFGTTSGIKSYDPSKGILSDEVISDSPVYSITSNDEMLVAGSIGEVIVKLKDKHYFFSTTYGSQKEYNTQGAASSGDYLLLGGTKGISVINKEALSKTLSYNRRTTNVTLSNLLIFNEVIKPNNKHLKNNINHEVKIILSHSEYPFSLEFTSPKGRGDIEYQYRLLELSPNWISTNGKDSATYTNLSPGDYTFQLFSQSKLDGSQSEIRSIKINVTPPWWLSLYAKSAYLLFTIMMLLLIFKAILRRREVQQKIAISEERLKLSLWGSGDEMWDWDIETGQIYRSNIWGSLEFPKDGQRSGSNDEESNIHPADRERVSSALQAHFNGKFDHFEAAYRVKGKQGSWIWILDRAKIVERDENDQPVRMTGTIKNINKFKHTEEQLRLFERAIENISEGMFILDSHYHFVEVNDACCSISSRSKTSFIGNLLSFDLYPENFSEQIRLILKQQGSWSGEIESQRGTDERFLMELTIDAIYDEQGLLTHYVGIFSDISLRKQQEEELRKLTNIDLLTGLPNRSNLLVTLSNLVKRQSHHTLMVLDLDNFKRINDSLGHQVGDELLTIIAKRIEASIPSYTYLYRLGGDEFALLVDKNPDIGSSAAIASRIIDSFALPFDVESEKLVLSASIGIVLYPEDEINEQALLRKADIAMYHAKSAGGGRYQFYSESLNRNAIRQLEVENLIREGLRDDLFEVYYQPKVGVHSSQLVGMEALVRLNHPTLGLVPPNDFIPLAEENGLIVDIGDLVLKKACFAAQKWREQGLFNGRVAVNLSSHQFALPDLQQRIESVLRLTQLPAENLELEITEGTVIKHPEKAILVMQKLAHMGVSLALDDFGTGYSSLSYLKRFPIHTLKIDKAFIDDIDKSDRDLKMVDSIITIAHNMGLSVVGEGVEEASQLNILKALNCEEIQGYYFSKAIPESDFGKLLITNHAENLSKQKTN